MVYSMHKSVILSLLGVVSNFGFWIRLNQFILYNNKHEYVARKYVYIAIMLCIQTIGVCVYTQHVHYYTPHTSF